MNNSCFIKKLVIIFVFVPIFLGLITLGVRLPSLSGYVKSGPKPRPRALLQTQIKNCKEKIEKICQEQAPARFTIHPKSAVVLISESCLFIQSSLEQNNHGTAISRAPPVPS